MTFLGVCEGAARSFLLWLTILAPRLLCSEVYVANVTDTSLSICRCVQEQELQHCNATHLQECDCESHPRQPLHYIRLAVWYSSALHVALLLHNAEVKHLSLVRCWGAPTAVPNGGMSATAAGISTDMGNTIAATATTKMATAPDHFVVQRLERLTVWPPPFQAGSHQDLLLGRELGAEHHEEPRIAVINTSILVGSPALKAYTVCTGLDAEGALPFPNLPMLPREHLPDSSSIFVTFLY